LPNRAASASIALESADGAGRVRAALEKATVARFIYAGVARSVAKDV